MAKFDPKIIAGSPRRNKFDLSYYSRITSRMGDLVPVMCKKIVPSDEFRVSLNSITRFAPLANPIYDRVRIDFDAFFVQNRILDPKFKEFLTGGIGLYGETSTEGMQNLSISCSFANEVKAKQYFGNASLLDYLGFGLSNEDIPSQSSAGTYNFTFAAEPILGYLKIYEDWYRNERFQPATYTELMKTFYDESSRVLTLGSHLSFLGLLKRNYFKDPYTTALGEPLIGGPVPIMSGLAPIVAPNSVAADSTVSVAPSNKLAYLAKDGAPGGNLYADLSSVVSNTVQQLNQMYALYRFFMKDTYNGNRYVEFVESHFGVRVPDSTLERPLFLGRYTQVAAFSEVFQTSGQTIEGAVGNTLGDYAGKGVSAGRGFLFQEKFLEHGYLYIIMSIVPESTYFQGLSDVFQIGDRFDTFYFPEFQNIGDDSIGVASLYSKSLFRGGVFNTSVDAIRNKIFGYQRRNWNLIWYGNELHGKFRTSQYNWTFARKFASEPVLSDVFSKVPEINNPFTYTATEAEPYYTDILFDIQALRPVERYESITTH